MNRIKRNQPFTLFSLYIIGTLGLNIFGPWEYYDFNIQDKVMVTIYISIFLMIASYFYKKGVSKFYKNKYYDSAQKKGKKNYMSIALFIMLFILVENLVLTGGSILNIGSIIGTMTNTYLNRGELSSERSIALTLYILMYFSIFISIVLGGYNYTKLNFKYKIGYLFLLISLLLNNILFIGSNKTIGDLAIIMLSLVLLKNKKKFKIKSIILIAFIIIVFVFFLSSIFYQRYIIVGSLDTLFFGTVKLNPESGLFNILPFSTAVGLSVFIHYISQGYYGLGLALKLPFEYSKGLGSSFFIADTIESISGYTINNSFPERVEQAFGWKAFASWHTIFPWIASDFTFLGALIIVGSFFYIYGLTYMESVENKNGFSIVLFCYLNIFLVYIPANNQIFQTSTSMISFVIIFLLWIKNHQKRELVVNF